MTSLSILLVDDDENFRERMARALRDRGHEVRTASGHAQVHDGALGRVLHREAAGLLRAPRGADVVAAVTERARHPLTEALVVVHQEDGERAHDTGTSGTVSRARVPSAGTETRLRSPPSCSARLRATKRPCPRPRRTPA